MATSALAGLACAQEAVAQAPTGPAEIEEVIVTARRVEENLQAVPVAVTALSSRQLEAQGVVTLLDVQRVTPGLTITPTASGATRPGYQIRGQRATSTGLAFDPPVAIYFGEVAATRAAGTPQSLFDISSVQILKGPQGTLFGRNTTGGAILITPNAPTDAFEGYVKGATGNYGLSDAEAVVNLPVSDQLQIRLAGKYYRRDGYFKNVLTNTRSWDEDNSSLRLSVRIKPTENITSDFIATKFYSNVQGFQPKLFDVYAPTTPAPFLARFQQELALANALGYYEYRSTLQALNKDDVKGIQNITVIDLSDNMRLKSIAGYRKLKNRFSSYADGSAFSALETLGFYRGDQFSEELQLQGEFGKIEYVAGLFYTVEEGDEINHLKNFGILPRSVNEYEGKNTSKSAFLHINYDLGDMVEGLTFSAGGRITKDKRYIDAHYRQERAPPSPRFVCTLFNPAPALNITNILTERGNCSQVTRASYTEPTWDLSLNWQATPDNLVYVAHRHGYRAGSAALLIAPALLPEKVDDIEFGSKNTFDIGGRTARLNIAAYYGKYKNLHRSVAVLLNGVAVAATFNAAKSHVYGLEADFQTRLTDDISVAASYALTIAKYDEFNNLAVPLLPNGTPSPAGTPPQLLDNSSSQFAYTPKHAVNASITYDLPLAADAGDASISLNYSYTSDQASVEANTKNLLDPWSLNNKTGLIPARGLFGLRADWRKPMGGAFDLGFFVTNLANKKYDAGRFALTNALGFATYWPGAPRMYGLELKVPFGD